MKNALLLTGCLLFVGFAILFLFPTFIIGFEGGFKPKQVCSDRSPNGQFQLMVTKKAAFPANSFIDPSIVIIAELRTVTNNLLIDSAHAKLSEDSDLSKPWIHWRTNAVSIEGFDRRKKQMLTLNYSP